MAHIATVTFYIEQIAFSSLSIWLICSSSVWLFTLTI